MLETAKQLVENIRLSGATLRLDGKRVLFTAPKTMAGDVKSAFLSALRARREEIVAFLVWEARETRSGTLSACGVSTCGGCYETELGLIHPPLPDPLFYQWRERMARR
jgi:hypothetical protein